MNKWKNDDWREFFKAALTVPMPSSIPYTSPEVNRFIVDRAEAIADESLRRMKEATKSFGVGYRVSR